MHAWLCETLDGAEALQWKEWPTPEPKPGEAPCEDSMLPPAEKMPSANSAS